MYNSQSNPASHAYLHASPSPTIGPFHVYVNLSVTPTSPVPAGTTEMLTATATQDAELTPGFGSVQFMDGATELGAPVQVFVGDFSGNTASITTTLTPGTHSLTAMLSPSFHVSNTVTYVVNPLTPPPPAGTTPTTITLQVFPNPGLTFFPEFLIAQVSPFGATGTVQFFDGTTAIGAPVPVTGDVVFTFAPLAEGAHTLTAVFSPTNGFGASTSTTVSVTVNSLFGL